jgi:GTP-binding protein Era
MIQLSYDPDAGTLYWYFTEIAAGAATAEAECASTLLLDADGQIIGLELELGEDVAPEDLALALGNPGVSFDARRGLLSVRLFDEAPDDARPLEELAVLDMDAAGSLLGCEVYPAPEFGLAERLVRLAPRLVNVDEAQGSELAGQGCATEGEAPALPTASLSTGDGSSTRRTQHADLTTPNGFRSGFAAIVGRPNVGKSTLLNALLGEKVAIVSPRPQTTRTQVRGVLHRPDAQIIFVDTPGIHQPKNRLGAMMVNQARSAIPDADVVCMMVDITRPPGALDERVAGLVRRVRAPRILVLNKVDLPHRDGPAHLQAYRALADWDMEVAISALRGEGLDALVDAITQRLPPGPPLYPPGQLTDQSTRERAAELVREQVLRLTKDEVPHGIAVEVEEWEQREHALYIRMTIYVEKESQKGILIGAGGAMLKRIGTQARPGIEALVGGPVFLDLWVKARPNWRDDPSSLRWLGYQE